MNTEVSDKKKLAAAMAGLAAYLQAEQEAAMAQLQAPAPPPEPMRLWGISGRQTQMMNRQLMQMRTFK